MISYPDNFFGLMPYLIRKIIIIKTQKDGGLKHVHLWVVVAATLHQTERGRTVVTIHEIY